MNVIKEIRELKMELTGGFVIYAVICMVYGFLDTILWLGNIIFESILGI